MAAEGTRARDTAEQSKDVPRDGMQPRAAGKLALEIGDQRLGRFPRGGEAGGLAEQQWIDLQETPRLLIGGAPHHDAIEVREMGPGLIEIDHAAIDHDGKTAMRRLEAVDAGVVERRDIPVLARREAGQPRLARMHDERPHPGLLHRIGQRFERLLRVLLVDADAAFDGDRNRDAAGHGGDAIADERGLGHEAGAEAALLHPIRRTADVEVDLVVAEVRGDARTLRKLPGIRAAELERNRMLGPIERQQPRAIAVQHRACRDHLGIEQRPACEQAMEEPAIPVGPFHHRSNGETIFHVLAVIGAARVRGPAT